MADEGAGAGGRVDAVAGAPVVRRALERCDRWLENVDLDRLAYAVLGLAVLASGALLYHLTRGTSFWGDDWLWITTRRGNTVDTFLAPYNGHLSVLPIAIYRVWFALFGIDSYAPYRALVIGLSLIVGLLVFEHARRRVGPWLAMLVAALVLFLGPGWQDTMWAFQSAWVLALGFGIGALLLLDRRTARSDLGACALTLAAICSTSFGVAFALGIAVDVALVRRRWRDAWIPLVPLVLYGIWALRYHPTGIVFSEITLVPSNLVRTLAGATAGLVGLSNATPINPTGTALTLGVPLVAVLAIVSVRAALAGRLGARALSLLVVLVAFSVLTTLGRAFETPLVSRYIYPDCVLVALFCVELARGVRPSRAAQAGIAALALVAVISNVGVLRTAGAYLRQTGANTDADLAALALARGSVPAGYATAGLSQDPYAPVSASRYYAAERVLGTPADSVSSLAHARASARTTADLELIDTHAILLSPGPSRATAGGTAPAIATATGGTAAAAGPCTRFAPSAAVTPGATAAVTLALSPGAVRVTSGAAPVAIAASRFGPTPEALGTIGPGRAGYVLVRRDAAAQRWQLQLRTGAAVRVCTLR